MSDPLYNKVILQLRAKPGFVGLMNQANETAGGGDILESVVTNEHGFLNTHSFKINSTNKIRLSSFFSNLWTGTGEFCFECRVRLNVLNTHNRLFTDPGNSSGNNRHYTINGSGRLYFGTGTTGSSIAQTSGTQLVINTDYHLAFVRFNDGTTGRGIRMFINGERVVNGNLAVYFNINNTSNTRLVIIGGGFDQTTYDLDGYMDDIRITMAPRYENNFTPPTNDDFTEPESSLYYFYRPDLLDTNIIEIADKEKTVQYERPFIGQWNTDVKTPELNCTDNYEFADTYGPVNIHGTTRIDSEPEPNILVSLLNRKSKRIIRQTVSDSQGNYTFKNVLADTTYMLIGEDNIYKPLNERKNAYIKDFVKIPSKSVVITGSPAVDINELEHTYEIEAYSLTEDTVFEFEPQPNVVFNPTSITLSPVLPKKKFKVTFTETGNYSLNTQLKEGYQRFSKFVTVK